MSKKITIPFVFSVLLVGTFFVHQHIQAPSQADDKEASYQEKPADVASKKNENGFKKKASLPIKLEAVDCFSSEPGADEDKSCLNNLLIARATLIDKLSEGKSLKSLDVAAIANKIVAKIYESPDSVEKKGAAICI